MPIAAKVGGSKDHGEGKKQDGARACKAGSRTKAREGEHRGQGGETSKDAQGQPNCKPRQQSSRPQSSRPRLPRRRRRAASLRRRRPRPRPRPRRARPKPNPPRPPQSRPPDQDQSQGAEIRAQDAGNGARHGQGHESPPPRLKRKTTRKAAPKAKPAAKPNSAGSASAKRPRAAPPSRNWPRRRHPRRSRRRPAATGARRCSCPRPSSP